MRPTIVQHSAELVLVPFITLLAPALDQPQIRHLLNLAETILVCGGGKTLSNLYRYWEARPTRKQRRIFFGKAPGSVKMWGVVAKQALLVAGWELPKSCICPLCR